MKLAMGQYDAPQIQEQPVFYLDPYRSNVAVFGAPMSGKTVFVKTLLVRLHEYMERTPRENIYILDFGGNLGDYCKLPGVCACFDGSNEENIKRVFRTLEKRLTENTKLLESRSYYAMLTRDPENTPEHMFLIIENINAFLADERYTSYQDRLLKLCRDGLSRGLTVVITANETVGISRLLANFGQKVAFEMPSESYFEIFNTKISKPMKLPGRGVVNIDSAAYEFQCFLPFPTVEDEAPLQALLEKTKQYQNPYVMVAFSDVLTRENFSQYCLSDDPVRQKPEEIVVGLDYYEHKPVKVDTAVSRSIAIYGKRQFGKSNLLSILLQGLKAGKPEARFVYFDDGRKQLLPFHDLDSSKSVYLTDVNSLRLYLAEEGYGASYPKPDSVLPQSKAKMAETRDTPFTVFVLQSKMLYRSQEAKYLMTVWLPTAMANAEDRKYLFIFSDVPRISEHDIRTIFNDNVSLAFLLDNIGEFVGDKGGQSVFGEMDARELKTEYAKCTLGDGYVYDTETDELQKLKFIKI